MRLGKEEIFHYLHGKIWQYIHLFGKGKGKGRAIPVQDYDRPGVFQEFQSPKYLALEGGKVVSPNNQAPSPLRNYTGYPFLLEDESTPGP
jgi:hypothetical protein